MGKASIILMLLLIGVVSCQQNKHEKAAAGAEAEEAAYTAIVEEGYELYVPKNEARAILILFGGFPETAADIKREFKILKLARKNQIAVLLSNLNQKLWLEENEKQQLADSLQKIILENELVNNKLFIGGFSSGGLVSLLISNYLTGNTQYAIQPENVFIVDSPIDLAALYASSKKNIKNNFSAVAVQESTWLLNMLVSNIGNPKDDIEKYEAKSVFTYKTNHTANLNNLKNTMIRLYTEPDSLWWKKNRMAEYQQMNAFYIKKLAEQLKLKGFKHVEYIPTSNRGYRANGERHPHSWSIVDKNDLMQWILHE